MKPIRIIPVARVAVPVGDNGFDICEDCGFVESTVCEHCEEGERFIDAEELKAVSA